MAPAQTGAASEQQQHPAKRRKTRRADDRNENENESENADDGDAQTEQRAETLSIRGRSRAADEAAGKHDHGHGHGHHREREPTDSPSAQLAGAVRSRLSRSPSDASPSRSRRSPSAASSSRRHPRDTDSSAYHSVSRSQSQSRSQSRSRSRSLSRSSLRSASSSSGSRHPGRHGRHAHSATSSSPPPPAAPPPLRPNYRRVFSMRGHSGAISQVRISPDGRWIASASADATARIWDAATGEHMTTLVGHLAGLSCLAWSPDANTLATGSDDKAIRLWDRVTGEPAHSLVRQAAVSDGLGLDGLDLSGETRNSAGNGNEGDKKGTAAARTRNRRREGLAGPAGSGGARGTRLPLLGHHNYVYCLAFSPKGNILASGSYDEAVFLWDVRAGRLMRSLPAHSDPVSGIDFCCDGTLVVSCSTDGLIRIWDTGTGQCLRTLLLLNEDNPAVTNVCFSPNGRYVLAFNLDSCIRLWDYVAQPSIVKKTYQGHLNKGFSIGGCFGVLEEAEADPEEDPEQDGSAYEPTPRRRAFVAAASEDGDVVLWDVGTKAIVQRLTGAHKDGVCFWVDVCGPTMVSCGQDGWINVYRHEGRTRQPAGPASTRTRTQS